MVNPDTDLAKHHECSFDMETDVDPVDGYTEIKFFGCHVGLTDYFNGSSLSLPINALHLLTVIAQEQ